MTGKELIIYILENDLLNEDVFKDGKFLGFISVEEAAVKYNTGVETIKAWTQLKFIPSIRLNGQIYIPDIEFDIGVDKK